MPAVKLAVVPWNVPNFVILQFAPRPRQEGFNEAPKLELAAVEAETLAQMCDNFRAEVFRKAGKPDPAQEGR